MKTVGIIGGIAPESTIEYYRSIISLYRERRGDGSYPQIIINSIDMKRMLDLIAAKDFKGSAVYLVAEVRKLAQAGADFGVLASNTPHIVFPEIQERSPIPLISIVETACDAAREKGWKKAGLFGTRFTMQGGFYAEVFSRRGIELVVPDPEEQEYIHEKYMGELVQGIFREETRARMATIADRLGKQQQIQGLILGGTELPLLFRDPLSGEIPLLDSTRVHVDRIVTEMLS